VETDSALCRIVVFRYSGHFENGGIPVRHMGINREDMDYMARIAGSKHGVHDQENVDSNEVAKSLEAGSLGAVGSQKMEIGAGLTPAERKSIEQKTRASEGREKPTLSMLAANRTDLDRMMCADDPSPPLTITGRTHTCDQMLILCNRPDALGSKVKSSCPFTCGLCTDRDAWTPCFPKACASGSPWLTQTSEGTFNIPYVFDENVDRVRRDAFTQATKAWE
ncbi:unnamed protein product, partial [Symbiodinium pilosum]